MATPANGDMFGGVSSAPPPSDQMVDLTTKFVSTSIYPPKSQIRRQKMIYHCKFGEFGVMEGQFTEPSGVAINAQNDIIVADTNNHRIQIFDKEGRFKFQFGCEYGRRIRDGKLAETVRNPNYRATTPQFWGSLAQVGDRNTWQMFGTPFCGKGEPNQIIRVGHGAPVCAFNQIEVFGGAA